jgi:hypothetical protein
MKARRSTIVMVVLGLVVLIVVVGAGTATWLYMSTVDSIDVDDRTATQALDEARARFAGQEPIIALRDDKAPVLLRLVPAAAPQTLHNLQILAWNSADARLTTVTLPFWLVRIRSSVPLSANGQQISLTADDLERYGPALFLDHVEEDGSRYLVWTD